MEEWTTVQFNEVPNLGTRKAILSWVEERTSGRVLLFNTTDFFGRRSYGFRFQREDDARIFERRWIRSRQDA